MEAALPFEEGSNPTLSGSQAQSFLLLEYCHSQGVQLVLRDIKLI